MRYTVVSLPVSALIFFLTKLGTLLLHRMTRAKRIASGPFKRATSKAFTLCLETMGPSTPVVHLTPTFFAPLMAVVHPLKDEVFWAVPHDGLASSHIARLEVEVQGMMHTGEWSQLFSVKKQTY